MVYLVIALVFGVVAAVVAHDRLETCWAGSSRGSSGPGLAVLLLPRDCCAQVRRVPGVPGGRRYDALAATAARSSSRRLEPGRRPDALRWD
jgi:hypothetical protein